MDTKQAIPMPVIIGVIAVVVIILGFVGYKMLFVPEETGHAVQPSGSSSGSRAPATR